MIKVQDLKIEIHFKLISLASMIIFHSFICIDLLLMNVILYAANNLFFDASVCEEQALHHFVANACVLNICVKSAVLPMTVLAMTH